MATPHDGDTNHNKTGVIALLDLPKASKTITLDGHSIILQRDDFVGFDKVPTIQHDDHNSASAFHLVTVQTRNAGHVGGITTGFVLYEEHNTNWIFARRYHAQTQEVSAVPMDDVSESNLHKAIATQQVERQRVISYNDIVKSFPTASNWIQQTNYISLELLEKRGLASRDKVVPGIYQNDEIVESQTPMQQVDGKSVSYPPIPVLLKNDQNHTIHHVGTKRYLSTLTPQARTSLLVSQNNNNLLHHVLNRHYGGNYKMVLGDLQLSFTLFLHLQCLSSMEHWRDLLSILSSVQFHDTASPAMLKLYSELLQVLNHQVSFIEQGLFEDLEMSGDNFFVPAMKRLCRECSNVDSPDLQRNLAGLTETLTRKFPTVLHVLDNDAAHNDMANHDNAMQLDNDEDGPVVVSNEEVNAAMERLSASKQQQSRYTNHDQALLQQQLQDKKEDYPLLFAALAPQEDVVMACARILDEANDVSLVRQAAVYLEQVESKRE